MTESFPRQQARTRGFSLGAPRSFQISPDGGRVAFLRSRGGNDPVTCLAASAIETGSTGTAGWSSRDREPLMQAVMSGSRPPLRSS